MLLREVFRFRQLLEYPYPCHDISYRLSVWRDWRFNFSGIDYRAVGESQFFAASVRLDRSFARIIGRQDHVQLVAEQLLQIAQITRRGVDRLPRIERAPQSITLRGRRHKLH